MRVLLTREPWSDYFSIHLPGKANVEELEPDDLRKWFYDHGVPKSKDLELESALDYCWNFKTVVIWIENYVEPKRTMPAFTPDI